MIDDSWKALSPERASALTDARLQVHHAAQLVTAFGISYLTPTHDDSHTNLAWVAELGALASRSLNGVRLTLRVRDLTFEVGGRSLPARGRDVAAVADWIRGALSAQGVDASRYSLDRHYEIPSHPVADGAAFDASEADLEQLSRWFADGALLLERLRARDSRASEVRCWPHHFDIATLITVGDERTVGVGLEPGDESYDEPYLYVNMSPRPRARAVSAVPLAGEGSWHTEGWIGAVLPGSRLRPDAEAQEAQATAFIESAVAAALALLG